MLKNDFESQNFAIFEEVGDNFGRSDDEMILSKNEDAFFLHTIERQVGAFYKLFFTSHSCCSTRR